MNQLSASMCGLLSRSVVSIFHFFVAGICSCWASPQAKVLSAENQTLVIVASHCILTSELEGFCETNLAQCKAGGNKSLPNARIWANVANVVQKLLPKQFALCQFISPSLENHKNRSPLALLGATRDLRSCQPIDFQEPPVV